jgi:hypothetical protein
VQHTGECYAAEAWTCAGDGALGLGLVGTPEEEECQWSDEDRDALLREIQQGGNASSTTQIVLG